MGTGPRRFDSCHPRHFEDSMKKPLETIVYWIDRILDRSCWTVYIGTERTEKDVTYNGVLHYVSMYDNVRAKYVHMPFFGRPYDS